MGDASLPITELVQRYRNGEPAAAEQLFNAYAQRLSRVAQQHLSRKLGPRVDADDVVQSVFRTFFARTAQGEFQIDSRAQLWQLLVKITITKARAQGRYHTAATRDVNVEQPGGDDDWFFNAMVCEPGPEEAAILVDEIQGVLRGLPELYCQVLQLRLEGHPVAEIADQLNMARRTVYRALKLLHERLIRQTGTASSGDSM